MTFEWRTQAEHILRPELVAEIEEAFAASDRWDAAHAQLRADFDAFVKRNYGAGFNPVDGEAA